ncbi:MAG: hypothetical protein ACNA7W_13325 [Pseudomonadales bacterium]
MWTRRTFALSCSAIAALFGATIPRAAAASTASHPEPRGARHPGLDVVAAALWSPQSVRQRTLLRRCIDAALPAPTPLLLRKEAECLQQLTEAGLKPLEAYRNINANDFRSGRTVTVAGVVLSEIDVATLLVSR